MQTSLPIRTMLSLLPTLFVCAVAIMCSSRVMHLNVIAMAIDAGFPPYKYKSNSFPHRAAACTPCI